MSVDGPPNAHAREDDEDSPAPARPVQLDLFGNAHDYALVQHSADVAREGIPNSWQELWDAPDLETEQRLAETETPSSGERSLWLSYKRSNLIRLKRRHGRKTLAYEYRQHFGHGIDPKWAATLADRGDDIRRKRGEMKTEAVVYQESHEIIEQAQALLQQAADLATEKEQPVAMVKAAEMMIVGAMEGARLAGGIRQVQRTKGELDINGKHTHEITVAPALVAALDLATELEAERVAALPVYEPQQIGPAERLDQQDDVIEADADWLED